MVTEPPGNGAISSTPDPSRYRNPRYVPDVVKWYPVRSPDALMPNAMLNDVLSRPWRYSHPWPSVYRTALIVPAAGPLTYPDTCPDALMPVIVGMSVPPTSPRS